MPLISKRMSLGVPLWVAFSGMSLCALSWLCWGIYLYWNDIRLVNFLAAWIPFVLSILLAFVPEHKMSTKKKVAWRSSVIAVGFIWSVVLWHQQVIADRTARDDQTRIVTQAVTQSTEHSDQQIGAVRSDVQGVKSDMQGVKKDLQDAVKKSTSSLSESIGKVGKPEPPQLARLRFTLWTNTTNSEQFPLVTETVLQMHQDSVTVEFTIQNIADVPAEDGELWIRICRDCRFAKEPEGFNHFKGSTEQDRHKTFQRILPGVALDKMTAEIVPPPIANRFEVDLFYGCKNCVVVTRPGPNKEVFFIDVERTN